MGSHLKIMYKKYWFSFEFLEKCMAIFIEKEPLSIVEPGF
jgi:hypothetical protein